MLYCLMDSGREVMQVGYSADLGPSLNRRIKQLLAGNPCKLKLFGTATGSVKRKTRYPFHA